MTRFIQGRSTRLDCYYRQGEREREKVCVGHCIETKPQTWVPCLCEAQGEIILRTVHLNLRLFVGVSPSWREEEKRLVWHVLTLLFLFTSTGTQEQQLQHSKMKPLEGMWTQCLQLEDEEGRREETDLKAAFTSTQVSTLRQCLQERTTPKTDWARLWNHLCTYQT